MAPGKNPNEKDLENETRHRVALYDGTGPPDTRNSPAGRTQPLPMGSLLYGDPARDPVTRFAAFRNLDLGGLAFIDSE
ncbi:MAG: hypothetical protein M1834_008722 [Cirrosporium novae-zelandiae]|nr:MAG: hypothetical protein M1834_008722 [Cirrosporium novae-zelandiae]